MQLLEKLRLGVTPAMATPIDDSGYRVAVERVDALVQFLIERDVAGLFVGGTTGEGLMLSLAERKRLHQAAVSATAGRIPLLLHVGDNTTRATFELAVHAAEIGADAIVVITPTFYPLSDDALFRYFSTVAEAAPDVPLLAYDIKHFANNTISPALLTRLQHALPTFAGVKCSDRDLQHVRRLIDATEPGRLLLAGNERILLGSLAHGADGAISGLSTAVPEPFVQMLAAVRAGRWQEAQQWSRLINQLLDTLAGRPRIGAVKAILAARGVAIGAPIPPRPRSDASIWQSLVDVIDAFAAPA